MGSENAKAVAREVAKKLGNSRQVILGEIARKKGYAKSTSRTPQNITNTQSYKEEIKPIKDRIENEINRIQSALESKDLTSEEYKDLVKALDINIKNLQLLGGKPTEILSPVLVKFINAENKNNRDTG